MKDIVEVAKEFIGTKEIGNNQGFDNPYYENLMKSIGWVPGQSWCAYAATLTWNRYYDGNKHAQAIIKHILHPHVQTMWSRAKSSQVVKTGTVPMIGAIACWAVGIGGKGHCGIVVDILDDGTFMSAEGNTSAGYKYNQSNGDGYYLKKRPIASNKTQLRLLGYIYLYTQ